MKRDLSTRTEPLSRENRIKKYKDKPPHKIFYNDNTIKWFRHRYPENLIKKSIYTLLPNNGAQMLKDEPTPLNIIMEWLESYCKPPDKYQNLWINPKYFFSKEIYNKILKLKEIFLQFDEDGSRKMEIDEMVTMFKTNHIEVTEDELCSLFFKGKKYRKQDIDKLYLDFYQFMQFALNKKSDQDFRVFMRKIKEKLMKEKEMQLKDKDKEIISASCGIENKEHDCEASDNESNNNNEIQPKKTNNTQSNSHTNDNDDNENILNNDEKNEPIFLPMNFNLVLDYFINKGKERMSQKKIRRAIKLMKNILNPGTYPPDDPDLVTEEEEVDPEESSKEDEHKGNKQEQENEYDTQLKEINTELLMEEFSKLFKMSYTTNRDIQKELEQKKKKKEFTRASTIAPQTVKLQPNDLRLVNKRFSTQKIEGQYQFRFNNENNKKKKQKRLIFTEIIRDSIDNKTVTEMNIMNYNKLRNVRLAKEETDKCLEMKGKEKKSQMIKGRNGQLKRGHDYYYNNTQGNVRLPVINSK